MQPFFFGQKVDYPTVQPTKKTGPLDPEDDDHNQSLCQTQQHPQASNSPRDWLSCYTALVHKERHMAKPKRRLQKDPHLKSQLSRQMKEWIAKMKVKPSVIYRLKIEQRWWDWMTLGLFG